MNKINRLAGLALAAASLVTLGGCVYEPGYYTRPGVAYNDEGYYRGGSSDDYAPGYYSPYYYSPYYYGSYWGAPYIGLGFYGSYWSGGHYRGGHGGSGHHSHSGGNTPPPPTSHRH